MAIVLLLGLGLWQWHIPRWVAYRLISNASSFGLKDVAFSRALSETHSEIIIWALDELRQDGSMPVNLIPLVINAMGDETSKPPEGSGPISATVRAHARWALAGNPDEANAAPRVGPEAIPLLIAALKHESHNLRSGAAFVLGRLAQSKCEGIEEAIPSLVLDLEDEDPDVRARAVEAVIILCQTHANIPIDRVVRVVLRDDDQHVRVAAATALGTSPPARRAETLAALTAALTPANDIEVRCRGVYALRKIAWARESTRGALLTFLNDPDSRFRGEVVLAFALLGYEGPPLEDPAQTLKDPDPVVRAKSIRALDERTDDESHPLIDLLHDESDLVRLEVCWKAGSIAKRMVDQQERPLIDSGIVNLHRLSRAGQGSKSDARDEIVISPPTPEDRKNSILLALDTVRRSDPNPVIREAAAEKLAAIDRLRADLKRQDQASGNLYRPPVRASDPNE